MYTNAKVKSITLNIVIIYFLCDLVYEVLPVELLYMTHIHAGDLLYVNSLSELTIPYKQMYCTSFI